jgi:putative endonuclease
MQGGFGSRREKGDFYEVLVEKHLLKNGYLIRERNFNGKFGELDIIAEDKKKHIIVFVEVKARDKNLGVHPFEAVDERKQRKLVLTAKEYMVEKNITDYFIRFDVAGVILSGSEVEAIEVLEDAFGA